MPDRRRLDRARRIQRIWDRATTVNQYVPRGTMGSSGSRKPSGQNRQIRPLDAQVNQLYGLELRIPEMRNIWGAKQKEPASWRQQPPTHVQEGNIDFDRPHRHQCVQPTQVWSPIGQPLKALAQTSVSVRQRSRAASRRNAAFRSRASTIVNINWGRTIFNGIAGEPPPEPKSIH